ncbi:MAG TPA: outer membrane beta-barrel protein, partial [Pseudomonadales bacterium]|nr:outer membrane beta-barrel protein [Pseudomonadales bacterium]
LSKQIVFAAVAVGSYPITDTFSVYGKLGVSSASSENNGLGEQTTRRTGLTGGIGAEYKFTPQIAGRLGLDSYAVAATIPTAVPALTQNSRATVVNAGISYSF